MAETPQDSKRGLKIDRKEIKKDDLFVSRGRNVLDGVMRQRSRFLPIALVIMLILGGVSAYQWWESKQLEKNWNKVHQAMSAEESKRWDEMKKTYGEVSGRPQFFIAVTLADHYFSESKKENTKDPKAVPASAAGALEWYDKALSFSSLLPAEKQLLMMDKGAALEIQKSLDQALTQYQAGVEAAPTYKALGLLNVARVNELKGDKAKAIETFEKVSTDFASTEYGRLARNHVRRLKSSFLNESKS